jgi:hypothetical protein
MMTFTPENLAYFDAALRQARRELAANFARYLRANITRRYRKERCEVCGADVLGRRCPFCYARSIG